MKYAYARLSLLLALMSCLSAEKPAELRERFKPCLSGVWVAADYIDDIEKTKSPLISSGRLTFISELIIDTTGIKDDSMYIAAGSGNHEGFDCILYFRKGETAASLLTNIIDFDNETDSYEIGYIAANADTSLVLYHYNKNKKLLDKTKYIKAFNKNNGDNLGDGLQYFVNKKLIAGTYKLTDTNGRERLVEFTDDGKIAGFDSYRTYYVLTDFVASPENSTDQICFEIQKTNQKCYGFKINGSRLTLFKNTEDETGTPSHPGPPVYSFTRQN